MLITKENIDTIIERWVQCARVLEGLDEHARTKHWDMSHWLSATRCGTVGCMAGHCAQDEWFMARGFYALWGETESVHPDDKGQRIFKGFETEPSDFFDALGNSNVFRGDVYTPEEVEARIKTHIRLLRHVRDDYAAFTESPTLRAAVANRSEGYYRSLIEPPRAARYPYG